MQKPEKKSSALPEEKGFAITCKEITKVYSKASSSIQERKRTWLLLLETLLHGKKNTKHKETFSAISGVSLKIKKGDAVGIIGLNGSGKSTLLQIVAGTLQPSSGETYSNGKIGALLELGSGFNPEFTGGENIYLNAKILGLSKSEVDKKYDQITSFSGIGDFVNQPVRTYSSGMVVRLAFSVIAHTDPDILIIDEALAVGDARFQSKCFSFLETFKEKGKTLLFVSHDINSIARLCSSAILLHNGKVKANGIPKNVINEYSKIISGDKTKPQESEISKEKNNSISKRPGNEILRSELLKSEKKNKSASEEFNYGGNKAEIIEFSILNKEGFETNVIQSSEIFHITFTVLGKSVVSKPIYALTIRDTKGQQIYGQNTLFSKLPTNDLKEGEKIKITFQLTANLGDGKYLISLGVTRFKENDELEVIHRRYDIEELQIINSDGSFGIANCNSSIKYEVQNNSK
jgi:ABC-type polysaccharide/polyol phosphate transport system ATPase subunit